MTLTSSVNRQPSTVKPRGYSGQSRRRFSYEECKPTSACSVTTCCSGPPLIQTYGVPDAPPGLHRYHCVLRHGPGIYCLDRSNYTIFSSAFSLLYQSPNFFNLYIRFLVLDTKTPINAWLAVYKTLFQQSAPS
jgi:hypothetical protein